MAAAIPDLDLRESRAARRLARLFRMERIGRLEQRPPTTARRISARRAALIEELLAAESRRARGAVPAPPEVRAAMAELMREVTRAREAAETRLAHLEAELRLRRGAGMASGLRGGFGGQLLGRG